METENSAESGNDEYIQFRFEVNPVNPGNEILIALLGEEGFESFEERCDGFDAYITSDQVNAVKFPESNSVEGIEFSFTKTVIAKQNWNETWEKSFSPVMIENKLCIRAHFHPAPPNELMDIVITPKMSFGTGHHDTTWLMCNFLFDEDLKEKKVLDMGCGTGVLAILAAKKGAEKITGIDIDAWSIENAQENCRINQTEKIVLIQGDASVLREQNYDIILANINRNILQRDLPAYVSVLEKGGQLFLSGFFEGDFHALYARCTELGLEEELREVRNGWGMMKFKKSH